MRLGHNCIGVTILRILVGSLAAGVLMGMLACGQPEEEGSSSRVRFPLPETFDLLESGFHQSTFWVGADERGGRLEVSVEVRQEKHDRHICGVPSLVDPFGNVLQTLTPQQISEKATNTHFVYESRYAFFVATDGEYAVKLENRGCLLDEVAAVATVQWAVHTVQE